MVGEDINQLIRKYDRTYVRGEKFSSQTNTSIKRKQRRAEKHEICDCLLNECEYIRLSSFQADFVHYLIDRFGDDFKSLHGRAKKEAIILSFIFYVMKLDDSRVKLSNYSICNKYGLTDDVFILIICRICDDFIKSSPIPVVESNRYDHDILSRNGGKI